MFYVIRLNVENDQCSLMDQGVGLYVAVSLCICDILFLYYGTFLLWLCIKLYKKTKHERERFKTVLDDSDKKKMHSAYSCGISKSISFQLRNIQM